MTEFRAAIPADASSASVCTVDAFRVRAKRLLAGPAPFAEGAHPGDFDLNPDAETTAQALIPAAVLVPIIMRSHLSVLLTVRTGHLPQHAGQIAFPGGRIEEADGGPLASALREAKEEIGLDPAFIEPLGFLEPYRTGTGFVITPVVALIEPHFELTPDPSEVAEVFEAPLDFLMDTANHRVECRLWRGAERRFYAMPYEQRYIWGATAGILKTLHRRLFAA